MAGMEVNK